VEGGLKKLFVKQETHGFTVYKHLNWDDYNWVAITSAGSIVVFKDRTDSTLYAIYNDHKGPYHVHIPLFDDVVAFDEKVNEVLKEVLNCLRHAECYVDRTLGGRDMIFSMNRYSLRGFIPFGTGPFENKYE